MTSRNRLTAAAFALVTLLAVAAQARADAFDDMKARWSGDAQRTCVTTGKCP